MALLTIITAPDPRLKVVCDPVETVDDSVRQILDDMLETMYDAPGIGLAAPQVGIRKRLIVIDVAREDEEPQPLCLVNPEILWHSDEVAIFDEGCLSLPEQYSEVRRPERVRVGYLDENGQKQELEADGLLATCVQHEIDHLDGILFVDHISTIKRGMILRKLQKLKKTSRPKAHA